MPKTTLHNHDADKRAAQALLREGLATYAELAALSGRARQVVRQWAQQIDAESAREEYLTKLWARTMRQNE